VNQPAFDFGESEFGDATNPTYSVGELADAINDTLKRGFSDGVWVRGEITGWSDRRTHAYFTLADDSTESGRGKAVVNVQFFANVRMRLRPLLKKHRLQLNDGMKVRIFGYLDYYAPTGRIGLKMAGIDPRHTLGEIAQTREDVLRRLTAEGLLEANKQHALSAVPLRVGVVASVGTAAWHDFHHELDQSSFRFQLMAIDTRVQGEYAEQMVAASIATLSRRADLDAIVVIRGGGARNELSVFDAEAIARAIAGSPRPVLTGLGHEVDRSVADEVAHTALKTPTACAGALIDRVSSYVATTERTWSEIVRATSDQLIAASGDLSEAAHRIARRTHAAVERADERLNMRVERLTQVAPAAIARADTRLANTTSQVLLRAATTVQRSGDRLDVNSARVAALDPAVQLARGWSITRGADGVLIRASADVAEGDILTTSIVDGTITSAATGSSSNPQDSDDKSPNSKD
jgi:exodeoxyribonuclease VII large subunit